MWINVLIFPIWGAVFIVPIGLLVLLQIWLCRKENWWFGLILPGLFFLLSLILTFAVVMGYVSTQGLGPYLIRFVYYGMFIIGSNLVDLLPLGGKTFVFTNIPTIILGYIWLCYQRRP